MRKPGRSEFDISKMRRKLEAAEGKTYWRSLQELAATPEFQDYLAHEFPANVDTWTDDLGRRRFLQLMGASLALAGLSACTVQPVEKIVPYVRAPEDVIPGKPLYFATAQPFLGYGQGLLVESHAGRPTKVEGNPDHSASLGAASTFGQASVLDLYDPDRAQVIRHRGLVQTWDLFLGSIRAELEALEEGGRGLRVLSEASTSPTLGAQKQEFSQLYPEARWHSYEPAAVTQTAKGSPRSSPSGFYRISEADVILSLDADFLYTGPGAVRYARDFASRRSPSGDDAPSMNRLYMIESSPTLAGAAADHRIVTQAGRVEILTEALSQRLANGSLSASLTAQEQRFLEAVAKDLQQAGSRCLVIPGDYQSQRVHNLARQMNERLDNLGRTVVYGEKYEIDRTDHVESLTALVQDMNAGRVELLVILGGNPVYSSPADLDFAAALENVRTAVHLTLHENETSDICHWIIPRSHFLESWEDIRFLDGTVSIIQPLIEPLYPSKSVLELMEVILARPAVNGYDIVRTHWQENGDFADFEKSWKKALHDGIVPSAGVREVTDTSPVSGLQESPEAPRPTAPGETRDEDTLEVIFRPDYSVLDGRYANNAWLQEMPDPLTKLTWDNAALLSPATAEEYDLQNEEVVQLKYRGRSVRAPVWIVPGHPDRSVTLPLGYGRDRVGRVGRGAGFNAFELQTSDAPWYGYGLSIEKTEDYYPLACTQDHYRMEGRHLVRAASLQEFQENSDVIQEEGHHFSPELDLYPDWEYEGYAWGMAVDLSKCTGCSACVIACQAENNIPVVGKTEVRVGREMHWIRIDRYYEGSLDRPRELHQPVMCQHCEKAPCEVVCPVAATVHSAEGLNDMIYNRCVGTRYCSNNCPYKVRRFNFLLYSEWETPSLKLQKNPDVTVRSRGVMEKCTYCVQRINQRKIEAKLEDRLVRDGEIQPACQQTCPADAIIFGDVSDPDSGVSRWKADKRNYRLLSELNTVPRTSYLGEIRNLNPELQPEPDVHD